MIRYASMLLTLLISSILRGQAGGPLKLHPQNTHYFIYGNRPTILVGAGEHYGSVINPDFDYKKYLQTISSEGLNITRLFIGAYIEKLGDFGILKNSLAPASGRLLLPWHRAEVPGYVLGGNKFDLRQWDEKYFLRLKDFMSEAQRNGVIVEATLFSSHYADGWNYSAFNPANNINKTGAIASAQVNTLENGNILSYQERYVKKIVRELNGFDNLYFEVQNEPWADQADTVLVRNEYSAASEWRSTIQVVSQRSNEWQKRVAKWIREEEAALAKKHLISQNVSNFFYPIADADPNISIFNFHYAFPEAVSANYHLDKVIGFNETGFAGRSDTTYRRQAWRFLMAGGGLFNQLDYSFSTGSENGQDTGYTAPGGGSPALRQQLRVLKKFFDGLDFLRLRPDQQIVKAAPGAATWSLSDNKAQWIIYYEPMALKQYEIQLNLPVGNYQAVWHDVITGSILKTEKVANGRLAVPQGSGDKVVILNRN